VAQGVGPEFKLQYWKKKKKKRKNEKKKKNSCKVITNSNALHRKRPVVMKILYIFRLSEHIGKMKKTDDIIDGKGERNKCYMHCW
jgi:hypothetical protein